MGATGFQRHHSGRCNEPGLWRQPSSVSPLPLPLLLSSIALSSISKVTLFTEVWTVSQLFVTNSPHTYITNMANWGSLQKQYAFWNAQLRRFGTSWYLLWSSSDANHYVIKKLASCETRRFIAVPTTAGHWKPSVIQEYQSTPSILLIVYFSINITSTLRSSKGALLKFFDWDFCHISYLFHQCRMIVPAHSHLSG